MKKLTAAVAAIATILSVAPTFAQDTIKDATPSATPSRGAGAFGAGNPGVEPRSNQSAVDGTAGRSAAPGPTVGNPSNGVVPPNPGNR